MKTEGLGGSCHSLSSLQIKCLHLELPLVPLHRLKLMCHCCSAACSAAEIAVLPKPREEKEEHSQLCLWKWLRVGRTLNRGYGGDRNGSGEEGMREGVGAALSPRFRGLAPPRPLGQMWRGWGGGTVGAVLCRVTVFCPVLPGVSPACQPALPLWAQEPGGSSGYSRPSAPVYWGCQSGRALCLASGMRTCQTRSR